MTVTNGITRATDALNHHFFLNHPFDAAAIIEKMSIDDAVAALSRQSVVVLVPVFNYLLPEYGARLITSLPNDISNKLLTELAPPTATRILGHLDGVERAARLDQLEENMKEHLSEILTYPPDTAGRLMDTRVRTFRENTTASEALNQIRDRKMRTARSLFIVDDGHHLSGKVMLEDLALAPDETLLSELEHPILASVRPIDSLQDVTEAFATKNVLDLPVLDLDGLFLGAVTHADLADTVQQEATIDMQTMVGAGKSERALSSPFFAVRKRLPWLQINLLTAFLAAAVVGLFEGTIAQVTALAVLLPVVAGQSGNTGAQALAVTMRGLALREVTIRQWFRIMNKEVIAGAVNGVAVAITCGIGVFVWSQSLGLVAVIAVSMVLAMTAAGFAGAVIPMVLTRLGQDPATSSSIILTTVTDVAGFFSFLGIATLLMAYL